MVFTYKLASAPVPQYPKIYEDYTLRLDATHRRHDPSQQTARSPRLRN